MKLDIWDPPCPDFQRALGPLGLHDFVSYGPQAHKCPCIKWQSSHNTKHFPIWKDVYVIPFIFMSFIPEWVRNEEMTQKWRLSAGMRLASSQSFLVIRLIRRSSKTQNDSRMRKNVIFKSFPRNNQTELSFVGKMFHLWDHGYRAANEWHRMTWKW